MRLVATALVAAGALACASSGTGVAGSATSRSAPNLITAAEIERVNAQNALEVVQKLRPAMLQHRQIASANAQATGEVIIYVDNSRYGGASYLRQIAASSIEMVRYFSPSEAQLKWGSGHPGGVIEVITKR